ncbi:integral membrane protein [Microbacterium sp. HM58-2]|nr:integral membrane protein [Microbacterium sp. HM58-2]
MAQRALSVARRWAHAPAALRIAVVYLLARLATTLLLIGAAAQSTSLSRFGPDPGLADFVLGWDAQWYWLVAENGYPAELPRTESGEVAENAWAFMPVFAYAAKGIGFLFGSWGVGAFLLSFVAGYLACLALHRLLRERIGRSAALWSVAFFAAGPLAAMFQVGYAESLFLLLLFLALDAVARRRYAWLYAIVPVMAFTRPGILAFALYLGLHGILRWIRRRDDPLAAREIVHIVALGALSTACGFAWQLIAGVVTGDPGAYLATELAWRRHWVAGGVEHFVPFEGWVQASQFWFGQWGMPQAWGPVVLVLLVVAAGAALLYAPPVRAIGADLRLWSASYLLYLLAVFFPQSSTFRLLLPLSPLWGAVAMPRSRWWRLGILSLCLGGQWVWIHHVYALGNTFWQVP